VTGSPAIGSRTIGDVRVEGDPREARSTEGVRDLVIVATVVVALSRFVDGPLAWAIAALLLAGVALAALQIIGEADPAGQSAGVAIESVISPALAAVAGAGLLRLVPLGLWLVPAFAFVAWFLDRVTSTEARLARASGPPSGADRTTLLVQGLVAAFGGFIGVAALGPGGLSLFGPPASAGGNAVDVLVKVPALELGLLAVADGVVAFLLGYRLAALRSSNARDVLWAASTAAAVVTITAAFLRSIDIPGLLGPALLVLVLFLWDAIHGSAPARRQDPRRYWEAALLVVLGIVVIVWSIGLRA